MKKLTTTRYIGASRGKYQVFIEIRTDDKNTVNRIVQLLTALKWAPLEITPKAWNKKMSVLNFNPSKYVRVYHLLYEEDIFEFLMYFGSEIQQQ